MSGESGSSPRLSMLSSKFCAIPSSVQTLQSLMCFAHVFEFLLCNAPEVNVELSHRSFVEPRNFSRGSHDFSKVIIFTPQLDEM